MGIRNPCSSNYLLRSGRIDTKGYVVINTIVEENWILVDIAHQVAQVI